MRNIHAHIISEYGKESVKIFQQQKKIEIKMADFKNHRRFSLRCLSKGIIPVSVKPKGNYIVKKAERTLLNESKVNKQHHHHLQMANRYMY